MVPILNPLGVDVSNHQGSINWSLVAGAENYFGFAKATEGTYFNDAWFSRNWRHMKEVGMYRGAYHFARPSSALPEQEAAFFLASVNNAGGLEPGDMLVLDMEDEKYWSGGAYGSAGAWSLGFCEYLESAVGFAPIIYTGRWYLDSRTMTQPELGKYPLWLAAYQVTMPAPPIPWEAVSFWQFTDSASVPGVRGGCDQNQFNGASDRIPLLGKPGAVVPDAPPPHYSVGSGILDAMRAHGDSPTTNEHYVTPDWSEAFGVMGWRYVYIASLNTVKVFKPE